MDFQFARALIVVRVLFFIILCFGSTACLAQTELDTLLQWLAYYDNQEDYERVIPCANEILESDPKNVEAHIRRGTAYHNLYWYYNCSHSTGKFMYRDRYYDSLAVVDLNTAIHLDPDNIVPYNNRGNLLLHSQEYVCAIKNYLKAISIDPLNAVPYSNLGLVFVDVGLWEESISWFDKAIAADSTDCESYHNRAASYNRLHEDELAINDYLTSIALCPQDYFSYYCLARTYKDMGERNKAMIYACGALELEPNNSDVKYLHKTLQRRIAERETREILSGLGTVVPEITRGW